MRIPYNYINLISSPPYNTQVLTTYRIDLITEPGKYF